MTVPFGDRVPAKSTASDFFQHSGSDTVKSKIKRALLGVAICVSTVFGSVAPAQAAVYAGRWDPAFGGIFPDLGWKGSATFIAPNSCLGLTGSFELGNPLCDAGAVQIQDAKLQLYNQTTDPLGLHILQTLDIGSPVLVNGVSFVTTAGVTDLTGVETGFFDPVKGSVSVASFGGHDYYFHLILGGDEAQLVYTRNAFDSPGCAITAPDNSPACGVSETAAHITFAPAVPEPSTYALMLAGMAVLFTVRRRRVSAPRA